MVESFKQVFDEMPERNRLCWNVTILRYLKCRRFEEALDVFWGMRCESNEKPDEATVVSNHFSLQSVEKFGAWFGEAREVFDGYVCTIQLYYHFNEAAALFQEVQTKMLKGDKFTEVALHRLCSVWSIRARGMDSQIGMKPGDFTFIVVLTDCVHRGLIDLLVHAPKLEYYGREYYDCAERR
ncbi:hypothetical protein FF1_017741 [Malus domestica]